MVQDGVGGSGWLMRVTVYIYIYVCVCVTARVWVRAQSTSDKQTALPSLGLVLLFNGDLRTKI